MKVRWSVEGACVRVAGSRLLLGEAGVGDGAEGRGRDRIRRGDGDEEEDW